MERRVAIRRATSAVFGLLALASLPWLGNGQELVAEHRKGEHRVPVTARDGFVYVRAQVNGNRAILLLDTGAALTTFNFKLVPTQKADSRIIINMAKGSVLAFRLPVGFTLGESNVREEHCSFHQEAIVGDFNFGGADGLICNDVVSAIKAVTFDFRNSVLILQYKLRSETLAVNSQNSSLTFSWIFRGEASPPRLAPRIPVGGLCIRKIWPNDGSELKLSGPPKFGWLKKLKN